MTPADLVHHLQVLQKLGFRTADFTRLHHDSLKGRNAYLSSAIAYFGKTGSLHGNNVSLAERCKYVADELESGRIDKEAAIAAALERWPIGNPPTEGDPKEQADSVRLSMLISVAESDVMSAVSETEGWEGERTERLVAHFERDPRLRAAAVHFHGTSCKACGFDFGRVYGPHGDDYIEVHHLVPVASLGQARKIDPKTDMTVLCANCHRMVHRRREEPLSIEQLRAILRACSSGA